jgi:hypothetical protein
MMILLKLTLCLVMKTVIFLKLFLSNFGYNKSRSWFSVPVDATNLYVDYRVGNKVYVKLLNQYTDILLW